MLVGDFHPISVLLDKAQAAQAAHLDRDDTSDGKENVDIDDDEDDDLDPDYEEQVDSDSDEDDELFLNHESEVDSDDNEDDDLDSLFDSDEEEEVDSNENEEDADKHEESMGNRNGSGRNDSGNFSFHDEEDVVRPAAGHARESSDNMAIEQGAVECMPAPSKEDGTKKRQCGEKEEDDSSCVIVDRMSSNA
jgi:hypothetical protein